MDFRRTWSLAAVLVFGVCLLPVAAAQQAVLPPGKQGVPAQVDPTSDLAKLYPQAGSIGLALAIVPDPHIPRYRRLFDLEIQAITLGMLDDGYVLDRYLFPWSSAEGAIPDSERSAFGLMVFRCDGWRGHACQDLSTLPAGADPVSGQTTRVRAIYLVTDTATWGVSTPPLVCAARRIRDHLGEAPAPDTQDGCAVAPVSHKTRVELLQFPGRCSAPSHKTLVVLGPNFSGGMDSIGEHAADLLGPQITDLCLVSSTTTESSNPRAEKAYAHVSYVPLAVDDGTKLLRLSDLAESFGFFQPKDDPGPATPGNRNRDIAFLTEASTFGYGVCNPWTQMSPEKLERINKFCRDALIVRFPAAIADIRYGIDQQREHQPTSVEAAVKAALQNEHLALDAGADNGSEFPESRQSKLTAASQQLALDHVLDQLEQFDPKMVVVVATDVRDRLFLFDQLRNRLPSAMLIDLETDVLLAHPDFLHASRGAVTVASANLFVRRGRLFGCERNAALRDKRARAPLASWALDGQGILADAISRLYDSSQTPTEQPCFLLDGAQKKFGARAPVLHVVTLSGLRPISRIRDLHPDSKSAYLASLAKMQTDVSIGQWMSVLCCFVIVLPWLWIPPLRKATKPPLIFEPWQITLGAALAGGLVWKYAICAAYGGVDPESGYALVYWSVAILSLALAGLYKCLKRVQESRHAIGDLRARHRYAIAAVGMFACVLSAAPIVAGYRMPPDTAPTDISLMTRLALDIGQGLAFEVVVALGVVTVLAIMVALATGLCILERNNRLLEISATCADREPRARTPRFTMAPIVGVVFFIALIAVPCLIPGLNGPRVTIFGPRASLIATLVLVVTTLGASIFTAVAIHASRRVRTISAHIGRCVAPPPSPGRTEPPGEYPGFWPPNDWQPDFFATTPVVARVSPEVTATLINDTQQPWKLLISEFLGKCDGGQRNNDGRHRRAVYALLASEVSLYRWFVGGSVLCAIVSVCAAYLFPLEADALLMWNLFVLVVHALLAGYVATTFERDGVLSNILCNRPKEAKFSASLFTYTALPFFGLGFAIAVSQVPGVVDWGGGLLALLKAVGLGP
jgi:hypothetical protein